MAARRIPPRNLDGELREALLALVRTLHSAALWTLPTIHDPDVHIAIPVPPSTWHALKAAGNAPPRFKIGRRVYVRTSDLRQWLEQQPTVTTPDS